MNDFLNALFGESVSETQRLAVFTLPDARTRHFSSPTDAAQYALAEAASKEVFFQVGLAGSNFDARNAAKEIVAIAGLWADIDLAAPWRPNKPLPKTVDEALTILALLPFPPSLLVDSGHGLHAYWLFKEPWIFGSGEERLKAARYAKGWVDTVRQAARSAGWEVDSVGDLARVLRLPGTFNRKADPPMAVSVVENRPERRYNPDDFEVYAAAEGPEEVPCVDGRALSLRPKAEPPAEKFAQLLLASPAFAQAWNRERQDLKDQSQSAYDLSLANIAALNDWTDQEVADLIIAARRKHGQKPAKALRADYMARTIGQARAAASERSAPEVDLSGLIGSPSAEPEPPGPPDPGPLPVELLRVPGFVSELMDHTLLSAPYPNQVMAFCGALAMQAFLAGRKVRDTGDNRTNLYILGLAHSAAGKDWPRKINIRIAHEVGLGDGVGERFASGEGIQDALFVNPCMLYQTDEIDGILQSINKAKDARHENAMSTMLTLYSSANSIYPMRRKAGNESPGLIDQPSLVIFGTAIPNHYYEALSERMLTNGYFARMIIAESGPRPKGQEASILDLPERILVTAKYWADLLPGFGNLNNWHPVPAVVKQTDDAKRLLVEAREMADAEYGLSEAQGDAVGTTVWGRVNEHIRKLALIYAVSENHQSPQITLPAAQWAMRFVLHQTRRMLFMASSHVAENPFHAECLRLLSKLRETPGRELPHSILLKRMKVEAQVFQKLIQTLCQQGDLDVVPTKTAGRGGIAYRLRGETSGESQGEG